MSRLGEGRLELVHFPGTCLIVQGAAGQFERDHFLWDRILVEGLEGFQKWEVRELPDDFFETRQVSSLDHMKSLEREETDSSSRSPLTSLLSPDRVWPQSRRPRVGDS